MNNEFYEDDTERWNEIDRIRWQVTERLQVPRGSLILDFLVGEGDFARTIAKSSMDSRVIAGEILASDLVEAKRRIKRDNLSREVELLRIDVTHVPFREESFDYAVNFSGWEDFSAISGKALVSRVFDEMVRVLKKNGFLVITFIPALEPKDETSAKDLELHRYMYKTSKKPEFFREEFFLQMLKRHGIRLLSKHTFETPKSRLRPRNAKGFLQWICRNYKDFYRPDVEMRSYTEILKEFEAFIKEHGIRETRSRFILLVGKKNGSNTVQNCLKPN